MSYWVPEKRETVFFKSNGSKLEIQRGDAYFLCLNNDHFSAYARPPTGSLRDKVIGVLHIAEAEEFTTHGKPLHFKVYKPGGKRPPYKVAHVKELKEESRILSLTLEQAFDFGQTVHLARSEQCVDITFLLYRAQSQQR